jgi:hypothetical protein
MRDSEFLDDSPTAAEQCEPTQPEPEKRNSGRTGPTSPEGRATSSKNSIKHGSCSQTLILPFEKEESWLLLLNRWLYTYQPPEDSLLHDFVLKTAQAEWYRMRAQRNLDCHECSQAGLSPANWTPDYIKKHDLLLRYKTTAERAFQRTFCLLEQFCKLHPTVASGPPASTCTENHAAASPRTTDPAPAPPTPLLIVGEDPDSPTGFTLLCECFGETETTIPRPFTPSTRIPAPPFAVRHLTWPVDFMSSSIRIHPWLKFWRSRRLPILRYNGRVLVDVSP